MIIKYFNYLAFTIACLLTWSCQAQVPEVLTIQTGAEQMELYLPELEGKTVALLVNNTSKIGDTHLLDTLLASGVQVTTIFAPEHGFRGDQSNGEKVLDGRDETTGLPIISLYGKNTKPKDGQLDGIDVVIYDIQDVGARFYTYISSMHYMMEACAENGIQFMLLDRPNPNGHYIDGPVLEEAHASFVGLHPIPIVYGMTTGELALMILGEGWLKGTDSLTLTVIPVQNWTHDTPYDLPIIPSPNLPNKQAIALYPSLCMFEGTSISVGRGTTFPFQTVGYPDPSFGSFTFTPISIPAASKYPKFENELCYGDDLRKVSVPDSIDLSYLIKCYERMPDKSKYFNAFFTNLSGTKKLRKQIEEGWTAEAIRATWQADLDQFKEKRKKYLLYD